MTSKKYALSEKEYEPLGVGWPLYVVILILMGFLISAILFSFRTNKLINTQLGPLIDATMEIKLAATNAHFDFEKLINGDHTERIDTIRQNLNDADWYAKALLEGGSKKENSYIPLNDGLLRAKAKNLRAELAAFQQIITRWKKHQGSGIDSDVDRQYDAIFQDFVNKDNEVEASLQCLMRHDINRLHKSETALLLVYLLLSIIAGKQTGGTPTGTQGGP